MRITVFLARLALIGAVVVSFTEPAAAGEVRAAVASNFTQVAKLLAKGFEGTTGNRLVLSFGSTGKLYTQIVQGAPFDVFLAADAKRPERLVREGKADPNSLRTYAVGTLVLWSPKADLIDREGTVLNAGSFARIAMANPKTAPYGVAAEETLRKMGVLDALRPKIVQGDNIGQTFQFVMTGNVDLGLVAGSQAIQQKSGSRWMVPESLHSPLVQKVVMLSGAGNKIASRAFLDYLRSMESRKLIESFGYRTND